VETKCLHYFHNACLFEWIKLNAKCPLCVQIIRDD
jgi:hypothetical protein